MVENARETRRCITAINLGSVISAHRQCLLDGVRKRISGHPRDDCQSLFVTSAGCSATTEEEKIHKTPLIEVLLSGSAVIRHVIINVVVQKKLLPHTKSRRLPVGTMTNKDRSIISCPSLSCGHKTVSYKQNIFTTGRRQTAPSR